MDITILSSLAISILILSLIIGFAIILDKINRKKNNKIMSEYKCNPISSGAIKLRVTKDIIPSEVFIKTKCCGDLPSIIPKDSITWGKKADWINGWANIYPEDNRYAANIPREYFEEVVEAVESKSEYKVGDWVTVLESPKHNWVSNMDKFIGKTYQIDNITGERSLKAKFSKIDDADGWDWNFINLRPATQEEIAKATKPTVDPEVEKHLELIKSKKFTTLKEIKHFLNSINTSYYIYDKLTGDNLSAKAENLRHLLYVPEKDTSQFEVGKWYEITAYHTNVKYTIKSKSTNGEAASCFITSNSSFINSPGSFTNVKLIREVPLSEIQQYLPDGHPDKIVVKEEYGEYVECIKSEEPQNFTIGKIYHIPNLKFTSNSGYTYSNTASVESFYPYCFSWKPSTKEAYDKQNQAKEKEWIPQVGEWVLSDNHYASLSPKKASQIMNIHNSGTRLQLAEGHFDKSDFRKALPHEIPQQDSDYIPPVMKWIPKYKVGDKFKKSRGQTITITKVGTSPKNAYIFDVNEMFDTEVYVDSLTKVDSGSTPSSDSMEDLLIEAKKRYPVGTKLLSVNNDTDLNRIHKVVGIPYMFDTYEIRIATTGTGYSSATIYKDGRWSKIVSLPEVKAEHPIKDTWYEVDASYKWLIKHSYIADDGVYYNSKACTPNDGYTSRSGGHLSQKSMENYKLADMEEVYKYFPEERAEATSLVDKMRPYSDMVNHRNSNELTSLPEKWYLRWKSKEACDLSNKYFTKDWQYLEDYQSRVDYSGKYYSKSMDMPSNYVEITLEQFKKWVLKKNAPNTTVNYIGGVDLEPKTSEYKWCTPITAGQSHVNNFKEAMEIFLYTDSYPSTVIKTPKPILLGNEAKKQSNQLIIIKNKNK